MSVQAILARLSYYYRTDSSGHRILKTIAYVEAMSLKTSDDYQSHAFKHAYRPTTRMHQYRIRINRNTQRNSCQHTPHTPRANSSKQSYHNRPIVVSTHPDQHIISPISHPPVKYFRESKREGGRGCLWALPPPSLHPTFSVQRLLVLLVVVVVVFCGWTPGCCGSGCCGCLGTGCFCGVFGIGSRCWLILGFLPEYFGVVGVMYGLGVIVACRACFWGVL